MFTLIVSNTHSYSYLIADLGFCAGPPEMTITSAWQHARVEIIPSRFSHVIIEISPKILLDRSGLEKDIFCILQWLWPCHFINFVLSWIQMRSQQYWPWWLHSFLHNAFYYTDLKDCIVFCITYFTTFTNVHEL